MSRIVVMRTLALVVLASGVAMYAFDTFEIGLFFLLTGIGLAFVIWPSRRRGYGRGRRDSGASAAAYDWHHDDPGGWGDGGGGGSGGGGSGD